MKKPTLIITLIAILSATSFYSKAQLYPSFTSRLQFVLDSVCVSNQITGVSAAVLVPNGGIWKGVHGTSYQGVPLRTNMLLGIGSNTKTFMSALLLKLQEGGKLSINDTIGKWIQNKPNINGQITIKQCLNHTSGIYSYTDYPSLNDSILLNPSRIWQLEEMLKFVNAPYFPKGTSWHYSNTNYIIIGIIIKTILGKNIETCLRENILTPQGLSNTIFYPQETGSLEIAHPWTINSPSGNLEDMLSWSGYSNNALYSMAGSAGAIMSTAEDDVKFWNQLISGQIINTSSLSQMLTFYSIGSSGGHPVGYGLGIFRYINYWNGHTIYSHGGTVPGYLNENAVDATTGVCISVLSNQDSIGNGQLFDVVVKALHDVSIQTPAMGIEETMREQSGVNIYPNPVADKITINVKNLVGNLSFILFDISGKQKFEEAISSSISTFNFDELENGIYFCLIKDEDGKIISRQKIFVRK
jgi:D-alanyl-D-alanine carboxypeptidase